MDEDLDLDEEQQADLQAIRQRKKQIVISHRCAAHAGWLITCALLHLLGVVLMHSSNAGMHQKPSSAALP